MQDNTLHNVSTLPAHWNEGLNDIIFMPDPAQLYLMVLK